MSHKIDICKYLNICRHIIVHSPSTFPQVSGILGHPLVCHRLPGHRGAPRSQARPSAGSGGAAQGGAVLGAGQGRAELDEVRFVEAGVDRAAPPAGARGGQHRGYQPGRGQPAAAAGVAGGVGA